MSLEQKIEELTAAIREQIELQKAIVEGQKKAVSLMESGGKAAAPAAAPAGETPARGRGRPPKAAEPAPQPAKVADPEPVVYTQDDLKKIAIDWRNSMTEDKRESADAFFRELATEFGVAKFMGPTGVNDPDDIKRAIFYIDRKRAGKAVDFKADYDFDGSPEQDAATPAAPADDDGGLFD